MTWCRSTDSGSFSATLRAADAKQQNPIPLIAFYSPNVYAHEKSHNVSLSISFFAVFPVILPAGIVRHGWVCLFSRIAAGCRWLSMLKMA
jgi:hypothetical protein